MSQRIPYICGPLTDLPTHEHGKIKSFYSRLADTCEKAPATFGFRGFAPHEKFDPVRYPNFTPEEIDKAEREQVCAKTCLLIAVYLAPSWGSGIEVEMANRSNVPVIILSPKGKKVSRLLLGNPAVRRVIEYDSEDDAVEKLMEYLSVGTFISERVA